MRRDGRTKPVVLNVQPGMDPHARRGDETSGAGVTTGKAIETFIAIETQ